MSVAEPMGSPFTISGADRRQEALVSQFPGGKGAERGSVCHWGLGKQDGAQVTRPRVQAEQQARDTGGLRGPWGRLGAPEESSQALNVCGFGVREKQKVGTKTCIYH